MIKSVGLLQRRAGLDAAGFRDHYENNHVPLAIEKLGFAGYQRNYPENEHVRRELGFDGFSEFWFRDAEEIARIGALMSGEVGAVMIEDELRFMTPPANQTYEVAERMHGERPAPGKALRALAIVRLPIGARPGARERGLDFDRERARERALPGVIAALHSLPVRAVTPPPPGTPGLGCVESLWLEDREVLAACNHWRSRAGVTPLCVVEESGAPILDASG